MPIQPAKKNDTIVVSALKARSSLGKLLRRIEVERKSFVIEKRGTPAAVLLNIRDYVKLAAPEPEVLKIIGDEAKESGKSAITSRQLGQVIKATRAATKKPCCFRCGSSWIRMSSFLRLSSRRAFNVRYFCWRFQSRYPSIFPKRSSR